jgi:hypothetical protein
MRQGLKGWQAIGARLAKSGFTTGFDAADLQAANALLAQPDKESLLPRTCLWRALRTHDAHRRRDSLWTVGVAGAVRQVLNGEAQTMAMIV